MLDLVTLVLFVGEASCSAQLITTTTVFDTAPREYTQQQVNMFNVGYVYGGTAAISDGVKDAVQKFITG